MTLEPLLLAGLRPHTPTAPQALQGLLEIKDTHRPKEGPMLLGISLPYGPRVVCVLNFEKPLYS
jgi:hypothetical protein